MRLRTRALRRGAAIRAGSRFHSFRAGSRFLWMLVVWGVFFGAPPRASAEDRVTVVGNYYRESSTRVLSPEVRVTVDAPDERLTLGAAYLLDAVSSASIATGTQTVTGGDNVFTELRHEATGTASSRLGDNQLGAFFRYSTETDYQSRSLGLSYGRDLLQRNVNLTGSYAYNFDRVYRIFDGQGRRLPWCGGSSEPNCSDGGTGVGSNLLQTHYASLGYTHTVWKTVLTLLTAEYANATGPQDNAYRGSLLPGITFETHPLERNRFTMLASVRGHIFKTEAPITLEGRYRFYADDWDVRSHAIDPRVHFRVARHVRLRVRYRFYTQSAAFFWRDDMQFVESDAVCSVGSIEGCATADPKLSKWLSHTAGLQLTYELDGLAGVTGWDWLEGGWLQATYNYVHQTNRYGPVRALGSLAASLAF